MSKPIPACPVEMTLQLIGDKWKILILRITQKVLTSNLRAMEDAGLLTREVFAEVPPRVEYTLTDTGYSLKPILDSMYSWGENYKRNLDVQ